MKKEIVYLPDYQEDPTLVKSEQEALEKVFGADYEVKVIELYFDSPNSAILFQLSHDGPYDVEPPAYVFAKGFASYFALFYMTESPCICINPRLGHDDIPSEMLHAYEHREPFSLYGNPLQYLRNNTCAIYSTDMVHATKLKSASFFKHVLTCQSTDINEDFINDKILPAIKLMDSYEWHDEYGVHFTDYGRTIDFVLPEIFNYCEEYVIPSGVVEIMPGVFEESMLSKVTLCGTLTELPYRCFANSRFLKEVVFSPWIHRICSSCFEGCVSLESVDLSKTGVNIIEEKAFADTSISSIELRFLQRCPESALPEGCRVSLSPRYLQLLLLGQELSRKLVDSYDSRTNAYLTELTRKNNY